MRTSFILVAIGAALAAAQGLSSLPACGQTCIKNMLALGPSLGCAAGNITCYCTTPDFGYGIRDCSLESCPTTADADKTIAYGVAYCKKYLSGGGGGASSGAASATPEASSLASVSASANGTGPSAGGKLVPLTTSTETGVETVGGKKVTTATGTTTIYGIASLIRTTSTESGVKTVDGKKVTTATGTTTKVIGTTTLTGKAAATAGKGNGSGTTTTKGSGSGGGSGGGKGGSGGSGGSGSSSSSSGNFASLAAAARGLLGAGLLAVLAL